LLHPRFSFWTAFADVRAKRGEIVGLRMDPADCHLFPIEP
jgi:hypothetical protein